MERRRGIGDVLLFASEEWFAVVASEQDDEPVQVGAEFVGGAGGMTDVVGQ